MTSHRLTRALMVGATSLMIAAASLVVQSPAQAAAPANDDIASFRALKAQTRVTQDASEATSDAADGECVHGASVWYRFRPRTTETLRLSTVGSDYDTVLAVFRGSRNDRSLMRCKDDDVNVASVTQVTFRVGTVYWVAVSACCGDAAAGGRLVLSLTRPVPLTATMAVTSAESGGVSGRMILTGTARCSTPAGFYLSGRVSQRVGGNVARAWLEVYGSTCNRRSGTWTATLDSETGWAFQPGQALLTLNASAWNGFENVQMPEQSSTITLVDNPNQVAPR